MENFDNLIVSLLDSDAMKGCFKKELSEKLGVDVSEITEVWLETQVIDGVIRQMLKVAFVDATIKKEKLVKLPFDHIYENCIVFKVGDTIL